jgi:hypothetical protein
VSTATVLADPLVEVRRALLADPAVEAMVAGRVYATPLLPPDRGYPCIQLTHIATGRFAPVGFRALAEARVQLDVWAHDQTTAAAAAGAALDAAVALSTPAVPRVTQLFASSEVDETVQPPLHRARADLAVTIARTQQEEHTHGR